jgi:flagellar basal-body rod protein FlgB
MNESIESITTAVLSLALDAASLRHQAIATNMANANTTGYVPLQISFEDQLQDARRALSNGGRLDTTALAGVQPLLLQATGISGMPAKILLDVEAANLAQNSVHFQALLKGLAKHYQVLSSAVSDGKR